MRFNTLLLLSGLLALAFGLSFLLVPGAVLPMYGVEAAPVTLLMARFFGGALVHLGLALYLARETRDLAVQRALALAGVVGSAAGAAVALMGVLGGLVNAWAGPAWRSTPSCSSATRAACGRALR